MTLLSCPSIPVLATSADGCELCVYHASPTRAFSTDAGGDLATALAADELGQLQWHSHGRTIALDLARAVYYLHSNGVKPCNECLHICAFGAAVLDWARLYLSTAASQEPPQQLNADPGKVCHPHDDAA
jgi:hypothetical protein